MGIKFRQVYLTIPSLITMLALGASVSAYASDNFQFKGVTTDAETVTFTDDGHTETGSAGIYSGTINGTAVNLFCVDPLHTINPGDSYQTDVQLANSAPAAWTDKQGYYEGGLGSEINSQDAAPGIGKLSSATQQLRAEEISTLANNFLNCPSTSIFTPYSFTKGYTVAQDEAAVNLSIWDIVEDGGNGLGSGMFTASGNTLSTYCSLVAGFESVASQMVDYTNSTAYWIQAPKQTSWYHKQNYIYCIAGVPETPSISILAIGFGGILLALAIRRRMVPNAG